MDKPLPLVEHLAELRKRVIICLVALGIGSILSFPFASVFLKILKLPADGVIEKLVFFSPQEAIMIYMNISFLCGWVLSIPVILYQIWAFISPALDQKKKHYAAYFVSFSSISFIIGVFFAYFILLPPSLRFLLNFAENDLEPVISAQKYISFLVTIILGCAMVFQMPTVSFILTRLKIINARILREKYKYAIVGIFIIAAVITPTVDALNMLLIAGPMVFLYEISIWISFFSRPKTTV